VGHSIMRHRPGLSDKRATAAAAAAGSHPSSSRQRPAVPGDGAIATVPYDVSDQSPPPPPAATLIQPRSIADPLDTVQSPGHSLTASRAVFDQLIAQITPRINLIDSRTSPALRRKIDLGFNFTL